MREEGPAALYKGFAPKVLRLAPGGGILLLVVEFTLGVFRQGTFDSLHAYTVADFFLQPWVHHTYKMTTCYTWHITLDRNADTSPFKQCQNTNWVAQPQNGKYKMLTPHRGIFFVHRNHDVDHQPSSIRARRTGRQTFSLSRPQCTRQPWLPVSTSSHSFRAQLRARQSSQRQKHRLLATHTGRSLSLQLVVPPRCYTGTGRYPPLWPRLAPRPRQACVTQSD